MCFSRMSTSLEFYRAIRICRMRSGVLERCPTISWRSRIHTLENGMRETCLAAAASVWDGDKYSCMRLFIIAMTPFYPILIQSKIVLLFYFWNKFSRLFSKSLFLKKKKKNRNLTEDWNNYPEMVLWNITV